MVREKQFKIRFTYTGQDVELQSGVIEKGTLLIKEGKIVNVGATISLPSNTTKIDLNGKSIYPSFIDIYTSYGVNKPKRGSKNAFITKGKIQIGTT